MEEASLMIGHGALSCLDFGSQDGSKSCVLCRPLCQGWQPLVLVLG